MLFRSARFTGDLPLPPGTLHAMVAVSPQAHARFSGIDHSAALAEPGVVAVLTAADIPGTNDIGNLFRGEPLLAVEEVHCVGEHYALVVADSADAAWRGAQKLRADWVYYGMGVPLRSVPSPYRRIVEPILAEVDRFRLAEPDVCLTVILPEFVTRHWWERLLHGQMALRIKAQLLLKPGVIVTSVRMHLPE